MRCTFAVANEDVQAVDVAGVLPVSDVTFAGVLLQQALLLTDIMLTCHICVRSVCAHMSHVGSLYLFFLSQQPGWTGLAKRGSHWYSSASCHQRPMLFISNIVTNGSHFTILLSTSQAQCKGEYVYIYIDAT